MNVPFLTATQKKILKTVQTKPPMTAKDIAAKLKTKPGPAARSAMSLVGQGLLRDTSKGYTRTAEGGKIAKRI